jgi:sugar phosphate isomerase/epimerase
VAPEAGVPEAGPDAADAQGPGQWVSTPFIMDTWYWSASVPIATQIQTIKDLGYQGFALSADHSVAEYVAAMGAASVSMPGIWVPVNAANYPAGLVASISGTGGWIWLSIQSAANDEAALALITALADECAGAGLPGVALYPHIGFWMPKVSDAVRLAEAAARPDVGVVFNQYHWMAVEGGADLEATLASALPYLKAVTLNGSNTSATILPLGMGEYDTSAIVNAVAALDYEGSVGLQGYGISGDIAAQLTSAKTAWDGMVGEFE